MSVPYRASVNRASPRAVVVAALLALAGCGSVPGPAAVQGPPRMEALSLVGKPLFTPPLTSAAQLRLEQDLADALAAYAANPDDADAIIWLGRRLAYVGRFRDALDMFTEGIAKHPGDARMYRHRGHRFITTRQFSHAIADLEHAARLVEGTPDEIEPDGAPNRYGVPVSTLQTNIWYHLALAHYLARDFEAAVPAWQRTLELSPNDDMVVAASDWLYMTLRRLGRDAEAHQVLDRIATAMHILENDAYHRRLLMYKGEIAPDELMRSDTEDPVQIATYGYGLANWYLYSGDRVNAEALFRRVVQGSSWPAFGFIAAEAELAGAAGR